MHESKYSAIHEVYLRESLIPTYTVPTYTLHIR